MTHFSFPYRIGADGRTASATPEEHVEQLIALVLFTAQGERANRPEFGSGVRQLVFTENAPELATALQHLVQGNLQRWLAEIVEVRSVNVAVEDNRLTVLVQYLLIATGELRATRLVREA
jgi:uncharacterized protein